MYCLSVRKRAEVLSMLCEGCSIASTCRHVGVDQRTVLTLLRDAGAFAAAYLDSELRGLRCRRVQADEIWSFVYMKEKHVLPAFKDLPSLGDAWLWLAICTQSKLAICYRLGCRGEVSATAFVKDLASRLKDRIQLSTDGHRPYITAVEAGFCSDSVDYAMIAKKAIVPESESTEPVGHVIFGEPDPLHINTSYIERYNLTIRMTNRRFTRKTNGFSKSFVNHNYAVALNILYYNFVRVHMAIGKTPAMAAGLAKKPWYYEDIIEKLEARKRAKDKPSGVVRITR